MDYRHTDHIGDSTLEVQDSIFDEGRIIITVVEGTDERSCYASREQARELRDALSAWLGEGEPEKAEDLTTYYVWHKAKGCAAHHMETVVRGPAHFDAREAARAAADDHRDDIEEGSTLIVVVHDEGEPVVYSLPVELSGIRVGAESDH